MHKFGAHSLANLPLYERAGGLVLDYFERQDSNSSVVVVANAMDGVEQCLAAFLNSSLEMHKALHKLDEAADIQRDVLRGLERPEVTDEVEQTISADVDAIKGVVNGVAYLRAVPQELITMVNEVGHKWSALTLHAMLRSKAAPSMMIDAHSIITVADPGKNSEEQNWDPDHESPTMEVRPKWRDTSERLATSAPFPCAHARPPETYALSPISRTSQWILTLRWLTGGGTLLCPVTKPCSMLLASSSSRGRRREMAKALRRLLELGGPISQPRFWAAC